LGNLGRNTVSGPNRVALDYSLMKNTGIPSISEQFRIQFRAEFKKRLATELDAWIQNNR